MTPEEKAELKRQITKRWFDPSPTARAQLEYILQEAGTLGAATPALGKDQKPGGRYSRMIPFLSKYRQQFYYERAYWLTRAEKRRALLLTFGIVLCLIIGLLLWMLR